MLNLSSFRDYINNNRPSVILYDDENNREQRPYNTLTMSLAFESVNIYFNPNTVTLKGNSGVMRFYNVIGAKIEAAGCLLGDIITLYCSIGNYRTTYTLIMR